MYQKIKQQPINTPEQEDKVGNKIMNTIVAKRIEFQTNRKSQYTDNPIFLFSDMDFFFMYNEDADRVSEAVGIDEAHAEDFAFTAFSARRLDQYLPILIRKGYRVVIVDNLF